MKKIFASKTVKLVAASGIGAAVSVLVSAANASRSSDAVAFTAEGVPYVKGELLVKARSKAALERFMSEQSDSLGVLSDRLAVSQSDTGSWYKVQVAGDSEMTEALENAIQSEGVLSAEPNYIYSINLGPGRPKPTPTPPNPGNGGPDYKPAPALPNPPVADPQVGQLYGLEKIDAAQAWETTIGSKNVIVADIDTGADYNHQDLINNMWQNAAEIAGDGIDNDKNGYIDDLVGYDMRDKDARPFDDNQHGSHTSGTIAATGGNGVGISGVAKVASVMVCRFLGGAQGSGTSEDAIKCIDYATANGAQIMSNSWGGGGFSQALMDSIKKANDKGILFVAAAGNSSANNDTTASYPANYDLPNVLSVAATDSGDGMASFSNYGVKSVHMGAPGVKILSTTPGDKYAAFSGTSMATPHVAGAAVLLKAAYPNLKAIELKALLMESAEQVSSLAGKTVTGGRLNISKALELAASRFGSPVK